jgi:hypothetical protein
VLKYGGKQEAPTFLKRKGKNTDVVVKKFLENKYKSKTSNSSYIVKHYGGILKLN